MRLTRKPISCHKCSQAMHIFDESFVMKNKVLLVLQDFGRLRSEAIDVPVGLTVSVANGDGESAVIRPDHLDRFAQLAADFHLVSFAPVIRLVTRPIRCLACEERETMN